MNNISLFSKCILFCLLVLSSHKSDSAEQLSAFGNQLELNGVAIHSELRTEWFIDGLYLANKSDNSSDIISSTGAKRMQMKVLAKELSARRLKRYWIDRIRNNNDVEEVLKLAKEVREFANLMGVNVVTNDVFDIDLVPGTGTIISINGHETGRASENLFSLVLNTWIGLRPPSEEFKQSILGPVQGQLLEQFAAISPSASRVAEFDLAAKKEAERLRKEEEDRIAEEKRKEEEKLAEEKRQKDLEAQFAEQARQDQLKQQEEERKVAEQAAAEKAAAEAVEQPKVVEIPAGPTEAELEALANAYKARLRNHFKSYFQYPARAIVRKHGAKILSKPKLGKSHGSVTVLLEVDRDGELVTASITKTSGEKILDNAVLSALFDAVPYPSMPEEIVDDTFQSTVVINIPKPR